MKRSLTLLAAGLLLTGFGQTLHAQHVRARLHSKDTADIRILSAAPDAFPEVSVVFEAQTRSGKPLWDLGADRVSVSENGRDCDVTYFASLTQDRSVSIALVLDHSASMLSDNYSQVNSVWLQYFYEQLEPGSPLSQAKKAVRKFLAGVDWQKDSVAVIGFSGTVDMIAPLSGNRQRALNMVDRMHPNSGTAFYDALLEGIAQVKDQSGTRLLIALTDGDDNASQHSLEEVIQKANYEKIAIYAIGLGELNPAPLKQLTTRTHGHFYYSKNALSLSKAYQEIRKNIQALYELRYASENLSGLDASRSIAIRFDDDQLVSKQQRFSYLLPKNTRCRLIEQEEQRHKLYLYAGGALFALPLGLLLIAYRRRKKEQKKKEQKEQQAPNNLRQV